MAFVNYNNKEITVKIVYYGPALSGKTTCLQYIYDSGEYRKKGKLITLDTDGDRTLFFDFLPIEIGKLGDYSIKMQLYTVPGQVAYNTTRKLVLQGSDGIVFVADSQVVMREQNVDSFNNLKENLKANNISYEETPLIFQYNKRDLRETLPIDILNKDLNPENKAFFPTIGTTGENILEGLHTIMKIVIIHLKNKLSIFQKDKTVMFSRDEITDSIAKKTTPKPAAAPPPPSKPTTRPQPDMVKSTPDPLPFPEPEPLVQNKMDTEKEEIFELSSPMADEPPPVDDFVPEPVSPPPPAPDEDIFNLGEESRFVSDEGDFDVPEVVLKDELGGDEAKAATAPNIDSSAAMKPPMGVEPPRRPVFEDDEQSSSQYQLKSEEMLPAPPPAPGNQNAPAYTAQVSSLGTDIPINIEVPQDKDEITINLNLKIVIKKKK